MFQYGLLLYLVFHLNLLRVSTYAKLNITAEVYDNVSAPFNRDAEELIQQIQRQMLDKNEKIGLIVDVGCGTGTSTKLVADFIPHARILAFDIDKEMVKASQFILRSKPSVEVFVQDISEPWEKLDVKLREVQGKVDVVWSNLVLHWTNYDFRAIVASNIVRLLRPRGRVFIHAELIPNFNEFLPKVEKEKNEKLLKIPSHEEQEKKWQDDFKNAGLSAVRVEYFPKYWEYKDFDILELLRSMAHMLETYLPPDMEKTEKNHIVEELCEYFKRSFAATAGTKLVEKIEAYHKTYHYFVFRITGQK